MRAKAKTQERETATMSELSDAINSPAPLDRDKANAISELARELRDRQQELASTEERIEQLKREVNALSMTRLPDLFEQYQINKFGLNAQGNSPACDLVLQPYYKAVMPKDSDEGLEWLEAEGHGDMVKRVITVTLPRDSQEEANGLTAFLENAGIPYEAKETVPWTTLTAFVKEQIEKYHRVLPLEKLGAIVGRVVKLKVSK